MSFLGRGLRVGPSVHAACCSWRSAAAQCPISGHSTVLGGFSAGDRAELASTSGRGFERSHSVYGGQPAFRRQLHAGASSSFAGEQHQQRPRQDLHSHPTFAASPLTGVPRSQSPPAAPVPPFRLELDSAPQPALIISPVACRVVVIGWMGSRRTYLNKYRSLWLRSGDHAVLMVRPTILQTMLRWRGVVTAGDDLDKIAKLHIQNPAMPTIYHVFSMGGFVHLGTLWRWMDEVEDVVLRRDLVEEVRGIILDSTPAMVTDDVAARALTSAITGRPAAAAGAVEAGGAWAGTLRHLLHLFLRRKSAKLRAQEVSDAWYNLAPYCPQLYLYSDSDPLVDSGEVEAFMKQQAGRGVEVSGHKWSGSGHCEHYKQFPHEYAYQVSQFLSRALRNW